MAISNRYKLRIGIGFVVCDIGQIRREVVCGSRIRYPRGLVWVERSSSGHGGEFIWWMPPLICVVHPLVTVECSVPRLVTDLVGWVRVGVWVPRLGILGIVEITSATVVILKRSTTTSIVTASTSSSVSMELVIERSSGRVVGSGGRAFVGSHSHMGEFFGVICSTLEKVFFGLHQGM